MKIIQYIDKNFKSLNPMIKMKDIAKIFYKTNQHIIIVEEDEKYLGVIIVDSLFLALLPPSLDLLDNYAFIKDFGALENEFLDQSKINLFVAEDLMNIHYPILNPNDSILKAVAILHYKKLRAIPVVEDEKILGIITRNAICKAISIQ
jgi:predicted transcriptional regulator